MPLEKITKLHVKEIRDLIVEKPTTISPDASLNELFKKMIDSSITRHVYVIDKGGKLLGSIRLNSLIEDLFPDLKIEAEEGGKARIGLGDLMKYKSEKVSEIMNDAPVFVYEDTQISDFLTIMIKEKINELPVVDKEKKVIGEVNALEILAYYVKNK